MPLPHILSQFLTADKFVLPVVQTKDLGVLLGFLPHVTSSSIQFCWLSLSTIQTWTASSPSLKHRLSPGLLQSPDRLPASPLASPVQFQHSCLTDSFKRDIRASVSMAQSPTGFSSHVKSPCLSPFLDSKVLALGDPPTWSSSSDRAHSILTSLLKRLLSQAHPDHRVKLHPYAHCFPHPSCPLSPRAHFFLFP